MVPRSVWSAMLAIVMILSHATCILDGGIYLVRHDTLEDRWELTMFDSGALNETRLSST